MRPAVWPAVVLAVAMLAGCGAGGAEEVPSVEVTATGSGAPASAAANSGTASEELEPDFTVSYDGEDCTSSLPEEIPAETFVLEVTNDGDGSLEFIIGFYDEGYERDDHLAYVEEHRGTVMGPPSFANNVFVKFVPEDDPFVGEVNLDPNRYYVVCVVKGFTDAIVLADLFVGD